MKYTYDNVVNNYELMRECFAQSKRTRYIHYTSQESFCAMFKDYLTQINQKTGNGKREYINLFASQMQYLNDKQEYKEGVEIVKSANVGNTDLIESIFICCFCGEEDLLSQWKYYGKNCGIAIEFDFDSDVELCWFSTYHNNSKCETNSAYWIELKPYNVFYENHQKEFEKITKTVENSIYKDISDKEATNIFVPYCKNKHFAEERESRLIFYPIKSVVQNGDLLLTNIEYRNTNGKIIPQFKCKIAYKDGAKPENSIPVKSVMIGPGYNQRLVFNSVINMLEPNKMNVKFYSDEEIDFILTNSINSYNHNELRLYNGRITYKTTNNILISMSAIPFRD